LVGGGGGGAVSLVVDVQRSRALARAARKFNSQALEATRCTWDGTDIVGGGAGGLLLVKVGGAKFWIADRWRRCSWR